MTARIEFAPVIKAKLVLDPKSRISPLELSTFSFKFFCATPLEMNCERASCFRWSVSWTPNKFHVQFACENIEVKPFWRAAPFRRLIQLFRPSGSEILWPVSLYLADLFSHVAIFKNLVIIILIIICNQEYTVILLNRAGQERARKGRAGQCRAVQIRAVQCSAVQCKAQCFTVGMKAATFVWNWQKVKKKFVFSRQWEL